MEQSAKPKPEVDTRTAKPLDPADAIVLDNVACQYRATSGANVQALRGMSLRIPLGAHWTMVGLSGSGKSSTLKAIAGLIEPTQGEVTFPAFGGPRPRDSLSMLFQGQSHFPFKTAARNIAFRLERAGLPKAVRQRHVRELVERVGLDPSQVLHRFLTELSGGQARRIELAMALAPIYGVNNTRAIMLLDEPTTGLDFLAKRDIQELIETLLASQNATTLTVTHDVEEAVILGQRVIIVKDGSVCAEIDIDLPFPRAPIRERPEVRDIVEQVLRILRNGTTHEDH